MISPHALSPLPPSCLYLAIATFLTLLTHSHIHLCPCLDGHTYVLVLCIIMLLFLVNFVDVSLLIYGCYHRIAPNSICDMPTQLACNCCRHFVFSHTLPSSFPNVCALHDFGLALSYSALLFIVLLLSSSSLCDSYGHCPRHGLRHHCCCI